MIIIVHMINDFDPKKLIYYVIKNSLSRCSLNNSQIFVFEAIRKLSIQCKSKHC